jgi:hypothetical protein
MNFMDLYFFAYMHKNMEIIPLCPPPPRDPSATQEMDPSQIQFETPGYDYVGEGSERRASLNTRLASGFNETRKEL